MKRIKGLDLIPHQFPRLFRTTPQLNSPHFDPNRLSQYEPQGKKTDSAVEEETRAPNRLFTNPEKACPVVANVVQWSHQNAGYRPLLPAVFEFVRAVGYTVGYTA